MSKDLRESAHQLPGSLSIGDPYEKDLNKVYTTVYIDQPHGGLVEMKNCFAMEVRLKFEVSSHSVVEIQGICCGGCRSIDPVVTEQKGAYARHSDADYPRLQYLIFPTDVIVLDGIRTYEASYYAPSGLLMRDKKDKVFGTITTMIDPDVHSSVFVTEFHISAYYKGSYNSIEGIIADILMPEGKK